MKKGVITVALDGMLLGGHFSGVERAIMGLAQSLAGEGRHKYRFFVPESCPHADPSGTSFETERVQISHSRLARMLWEQRKLPTLLKGGSFDLLHAPAYLAPLSAELPVVLTVYDLQTLLFPKMCRTLNRINYRIMLPRSIRMASGIIVPSESVRKDMTDLFPDTKDIIEVIPIGMNPLCRTLEPDDYATTLGKLGVTEPFILFSGNMAPNKNLLTLVHAFGKLKRNHNIDHKLVLAGRKAWQYEEVRRCIQEEGLSEEVLCVGYVSDEDLIGLYNAADLFVFPSLYEGFGVPPLEAMLCGTPVVCSGAGGLAETVGPAAVMVDPTEVGGIADAIAEVIRDRALPQELREKGLQWAQKFTWGNARLQTEAFYEKVLASA